ncbi:hypothetical protein B0F90DRAFT_1677198 [Multifurca ochricompacta]|uniref:Uncharacterized protein n=1 Tax=Multifurca ochricompacta TaxID=376703 RepID=A0AAD4MCE8_9AGAM|nr:hypothetical protein B0F90DRAFT_1677198 [Multifurca ochricompacta]
MPGSNSVGQAPRDFLQVFPPEVLYLIRAVMHSDQNATPGSEPLPFARPDGAQILLLYWGEVVPWSWTVWNDPRFADIELITQLTASWMCHMDTPYMHVRWLRPRNWQKMLLSAATSNYHDTVVVMTQLLNFIATVPPYQKFGGNSPMWLNLLLRTCWSTAKLIDPFHFWHAAATPILTKSMCCILVDCMAEGTGLEAQEAIIEALTHVDVDQFHAAIRALQQSRFFSTLDNTIGALQRVICSATETRAPLISTMIRTVCLTMNFLTLCFSVAPRLCHGVSVSTFLHTVATYASELNASYLSCPLLTAVSTLEGTRDNTSSDKSVNAEVDTIPWEIALSCPRSDILVASCLASCVLAVEHLGSPCTSTAVEIWDYLRDVLLLILTEHYAGDEAPLSLLVAPTLCVALRVLLGRIGGRLVTWTLCSPWTKNLCTELLALLEGKENGHSKTRTILKSQLSLVGMKLIRMLENENGGIGMGEDEEIMGMGMGMCMGMKSVYYKGHIVRIVSVRNLI